MAWALLRAGPGGRVLAPLLPGGAAGGSPAWGHPPSRLTSAAAGPGGRASPGMSQGAWPWPGWLRGAWQAAGTGPGSSARGSSRPGSQAGGGGPTWPGMRGVTPTPHSAARPRETRVPAASAARVGGVGCQAGGQSALPSRVGIPRVAPGAGARGSGRGPSGGQCGPGRTAPREWGRAARAWPSVYVCACHSTLTGRSLLVRPRLRRRPLPPPIGRFEHKGPGSPRPLRGPPHSRGVRGSQSARGRRGAASQGTRV